MFLIVQDAVEGLMKQAADEVDKQNVFYLPALFAKTIAQTCHCDIVSKFVLSQAGLELNMELPGAQSATIGQSTQVRLRGEDLRNVQQRTQFLSKGFPVNLRSSFNL